MRLLAIPSVIGDADLALINERFALRPLTAEDVFTFPAVIATDAVDSYFTHHDPVTTLRNFAQDLTAGEPLLDSHDGMRLPIGRAYRGVVQPVAGGQAEGAPAMMQVIGDYYMLRGHVVQGQQVDDYIRGILGGTSSDLSAGFGGPEIEIVCDIDGSSLFDWESEHYPGQRRDDGTVVTYTVRNARLIESSLVYSGSTPGAVVQRVAGLVEARRIPPAEIARLEHRWGVRFPAPGPGLVPGWGDGTRRKGQSDMEFMARVEAAFTRAGAVLRKELRDRLTAAAQQHADVGTVIAEVIEAVTPTEDERAALVELGGERSAQAVASLKAQAQAGAAYATRLIDEAVQAKVAAKGDGFDGDAYRQRLQRAAQSGDLAYLEEERDDWMRERSQLYQRGRQTLTPVRGDGPAGNGLVIEEIPL